MVYLPPNAARELYCSVSISLSQDLKKRLDQYLEVEPKTPIIDVPKIKLHTLRDMFESMESRLSRRCIAPNP